MFKEPLYNAIVRGNKAQTRRVVKIDSKEEIVTEVHNSENPRILVESDIKQRVIYPRYNVGETVYLKEPYLPDFFDKSIAREYYEGNTTAYGFDYNNTVEAQEAYPGLKFKNKMFMPEKYARRFIKITNIRVERLQDITRSDIRSEGLIVPEHLRSDDIEYNYRQWLPDEWKRLWGSINKPPYSWADNPFNWVYEFELTEKSE